MDSKRQHTLPRFLLRGFSSRQSKPEFYTWVYRNNVEAFETNITNVGVTKDFYTEDKDYTVDKSITIIENQFAQELEKFRNYKSTQTIVSNIISSFVSHLEIRSRHLRYSFLEVSEDLIDIFFERFRDPDIRNEFFLKMIEDDPSILKRGVDQNLRGRNVSQRQREFYYKEAQRNIDKMLPLMSPLINSYMKLLKSKIKKGLPDSLKDGHIRALKINVIPEIRKEYYDQLKWFVYVFDEDDLILGDSGLVFKIDSQRKYKTYLEKKDELICIYIPMSSTHLIIGNKHLNIEKIEQMQLNEDIASCSHEFFIANKHASSFDEMISIIGTNSELITSEEIEIIFREWLNSNN